MNIMHSLLFTRDIVRSIFQPFSHLSCQGCFEVFPTKTLLHTAHSNLQYLFLSGRTIRLTNTHRAEVSKMVKRHNVTRVLSLKCFLVLLPSYIHMYLLEMHHCINDYYNRNTPDPQYSSLLTYDRDSMS